MNGKSLKEKHHCFKKYIGWYGCQFDCMDRRKNCVFEKIKRIIHTSRVLIMV